MVLLEFFSPPPSSEENKNAVTLLPRISLCD